MESVGAARCRRSWRSSARRCRRAVVPMSDGREFASEEERWEALRGEGVEAAAPDGWEPGEGEDGGFEEVPDGV